MCRYQRKKPEKVSEYELTHLATIRVESNVCQRTDQGSTGLEFTPWD